MSFDHGKGANIYIVFEINRNFEIDIYPTLKNCLVDAVKSTKHTDIGKYKYSGYGIGFDRKGFFSLDNETGTNVITFGLDMNSSSHIDNKKKRYFNSWKWPHTRIRTYTDCSKIVLNQLY